MSRIPGAVVVGVDGSADAQRAVRWAAEQAAVEHRPLALVHAVHDLTPRYLDAHALRTELEAAGRTVLEEGRALATRDFPGLEVREVIDLADPRELLLQLSAEAAMVVVGSRGLGPVRSLLLGSVGAALVRHARCPVVVVRPRPADGAHHGIVVGLDATESSQVATDFAFRQASAWQVPLTVLHATWDSNAGRTGASHVTHELPTDEAERLGLSMCLAGLEQKYPDVTVSRRLGRGRPEEVLTHASESAELVVVGAHQQALRRALTGSVSSALVEHARTSVAVVPLAPFPAVEAA